MKRNITIGSISHGTLRTEDLLPAFHDELQRVAPRRYGALRAEARRAMRHPDDENAVEILSDLFDALDECAPIGMRFGNTEGDGSDYGWWPDFHWIDELDQFDDTDVARKLKWLGEFKTVNDHGNVEVFCRMGNGRIVNLFGVV